MTNNQLNEPSIPIPEDCTIRRRGAYETTSRQRLCKVGAQLPKWRC